MFNKTTDPTVSAKIPATISTRENSAREVSDQSGMDLYPG
jgi:hypothetical protein